VSAPVKFPAIFSGIRSRKDKTFSLTFDTQEMSGKDAAALMDLQQSYCALLIAPTEQDLEGVEILDYRPLEGQTKTPAQRLRSVLYIYHAQQGGKDVLGDFDSWYARVVERWIDAWKAKLDSGQE
jgi:hypothetical protein